MSLEQANAVRTARAQLKRELERGEQQLSDVLTSPPPCTKTMAVLELLLATHNIGPVSTRKALSAVGVDPAKAVGALTERQRHRIVYELFKLGLPKHPN